tara:strand:- start:46737 stop:48509 length:1773 start_codon:yes stop_codon:yes gene_type:complete
MSTNITKKPNIVIIGASGHAKVIIDIIERLNKYNIIGLIDSFKPIGSSIFNYKILGSEKEITNLGNIYNFNEGIIAIGDNWTRKTIHNKIKRIAPHFGFINAIHPNSIIGKNVKIGTGTVIMAGVIVNSDARIGHFCIINTKASLGHDSILNEYSSLAPNATIGGNVEIGICSAISLGSNIIQDITIGKHSIIGAGSLVVRDIDDFSMAYGVPAKFIKKIKKGEKYLYHQKTENKKSKLISKDPYLKLITEEEQWNDVISEIGYYDFYHTYDYHKSSKSEGETPTLLKYRHNDVLIALPLLVRDIPNTNYKDATSVYGYGGPISKGVNNNFDNTTFVDQITKYFKSNSIISIFSRLNPYMRQQCVILKDFGNIISQGKIVNIDLSLTLDEQRALYRSRLKTHINKARRSCSIRRASSIEDIKTYIEIYHENMDRVKAKKIYYFSCSYFENLIKSKDFKTEILLAIDNESGEIIAGSMFIITNSIVQYHLSGSKNDFLHLTPTKLLIDEMRLIANDEGYKFFNLGGGIGGSDHDSLFDFKSSFSKDFKDFNLWNVIIDQGVYDNLVASKGINTNSDYFPLYRSLDQINIDL